MIECKICNKELETPEHLYHHIKKDHTISWQEYLKIYIWKPFKYMEITITPGTCPICGNSIILKYGKLQKFCSCKCRDTFSKNSNMLAESMKVKAKETNLKKYGCEIANQSDLIKEKSKQTFIKKYGVENPFSLDIIKNKRKQTCIELYGVEYAPQAEIVKEKIKNTSFEKYGVSNPGASAEAIEKLLKTNNERYGANSALQTPNGKATLKQILASEAVRKKVYETHKRNNSFNTSKPELKLLEILQNKFGDFDIEYQYRSSKYPFVCDFYIKSLDLYIELQGSWTHGKAPYDPDSKEHQQKLNDWILKAKKSQFYRNAIDVWTVRDPLKRRVAKENGIKLIEVFDSKTFKELDFILKKDLK